MLAVLSKVSLTNPPFYLCQKNPTFVQIMGSKVLKKDGTLPFPQRLNSDWPKSTMPVIGSHDMYLQDPVLSIGILGQVS